MSVKFTIQSDPEFYFKVSGTWKNKIKAIFSHGLSTALMHTVIFSNNLNWWGNKYKN